MIPSLQPITYPATRDLAERDNLEPRKGFTLMEVTVGAGIFITAIVIILGIMVGVSKAQRKIVNIQLVQDNMRFATELITKEMRMGKAFTLTNTCTATLGEELSYNTWFNPANAVEKRVYFKDGSTLKRIAVCETCATPCGSATEFLGGDVLLDQLRFTLRGGVQGAADGQPMVTLALTARSANPDTALQSETNLQTTVVQRLRDLRSAGPPVIPPPTLTLDRQVAHDDDDAEERVSNGNMSLGSNDLDMVTAGGNAQEVGMRFLNITIPQGANITNAWLTFVADANDSGATDLTFYGQNADNAARFGSGNFNITSRPKTTASVAWTGVPSWNSGTSYQTAVNLEPIIQEIVNRPTWSSGNPLVIIVNGSGQRAAVSRDNTPSEAPLLHVEYQ